MKGYCKYCKKLNFLLSLFQRELTDKKQFCSVSDKTAMRIIPLDDTKENILIVFNIQQPIVLDDQIKDFNIASRRICSIFLPIGNKIFIKTTWEVFA